MVGEGRVRDFFGFNRAQHAVLEAAILATRVGLLPAGEIFAQLERLRPLVAKTGGPRTAGLGVSGAVHPPARAARVACETSKLMSSAVRVWAPSRLHFGCCRSGSTVSGSTAAPA